MINTNSTNCTIVNSDKFSDENRFNFHSGNFLLYYMEFLSKVLNYLNVPLGTTQIFFFCFHIFTHMQSPHHAFCHQMPCKMFIGAEFRKNALVMWRTIKLQMINLKQCILRRPAQSQSTKVSFTFGTCTGIILFAIKCLKMWGTHFLFGSSNFYIWPMTYTKCFYFCAIIHVEYWTLKALVFLHYPAFLLWAQVLHRNCCRKMPCLINIHLMTSAEWGGTCCDAIFTNTPSFRLFLLTSTYYILVFHNMHINKHFTQP